MKPITKVFIVIGTLLLCLLVWAAFFDHGLLANAWNVMAGGVNDTINKIFGKDVDIIPEWDESGTTLDDGNGAF